MVPGRDPDKLGSLGTPVRVTGSPIRLSATLPTYDLRPPLLGEHNGEVLRSLGYTVRLPVFRLLALPLAVRSRSRGET